MATASGRPLLALLKSLLLPCAGGLTCFRLPCAAVVAAAPPVLAAAGSDAVVDPSEDRRVQRVQRIAHDTRVRLIRAASRLGLAPRTDQVAQFLQVGKEVVLGKRKRHGRVSG